MTEINQIKRRLEQWSGFTVDLDENNSLEEWQSHIQELVDQLTNEISDRGMKFEQEIKKIIPEED